MTTQEIKIIEVSIENAELPERFCVQERDERYYIAFETDINKPYSILFKDLDWIRKNFGDENSIITYESLNVGRKNHISDLKLALKANVPMFELDRVNPDGSIKIDIKTGEPVRVTKLSNSGREMFQKNIDKGLLVLCKYVD